MKKTLYLLALLMSCNFCIAQEEFETPNQVKKVPIEFDVQAFAKLLKKLDGLEEKVSSLEKALKNKKTIAFCALGREHISEGIRSQLEYSEEILDQGDIWDGKTFTAPKDGIYFFTISFVKEPYYDNGTQDDVYIIAKFNETEIPIFAWAGQTDQKDRSTGVCSFVQEMKKGDLLSTYAHSDGDSETRRFKRKILNYHISGFKIE